MEEIKLVQAPKITHDLVAVGKSVTARLDALNLNNQVVTSDTIQSLKNLRAELNKEFAEYEDQRKTIKKLVNEPYTEMEDVYKREITEKYNAAGETLKTKIGQFEDLQKEEKRNNIFSYFTELCFSEEIDFIKFDDLGLKFDLTTTEKKYREQIDAFISKVKDDLQLIDTQEAKAEILVEFKKTLNASKAITTVTERKAAEREEELRIQEQKILNRKNALLAANLTFDEMTKVYAFNDDIYISQNDLEILTPEAFKIKLDTIKQQIAELQPSETVKAPTVATQSAESEKVFRLHFEAFATKKQAEKLKQFLIENNIEYKNL